MYITVRTSQFLTEMLMGEITRVVGMLLVDKVEVVHRDNINMI